MLFQSSAGKNNENIDWNNVGNKRNHDTLINNYGTVSTTSTGSLAYTQPMDEQQAAQTLSEYSIDSNLVSS